MFAGCLQIMWAHSHLIRAGGVGYSQIIRAENTDVCRSCDLCLQAATGSLFKNLKPHMPDHISIYMNSLRLLLFSDLLITHALSNKYILNLKYQRIPRLHLEHW